MAFPILQGLFKYDLTDYYAILGAPINADSKQIRQRYLQVAYRLHPDTCKASTEMGKRKANRLLSRLVNPAYEKLSKEVPRREFLIVLSQVGRNLATDKDNLQLVHQPSQKLLKVNKNLDLAYYKLISSLISQQYTDLEKIYQITAAISELNLVYLVLREDQGIHHAQSSVSVSDANISGSSSSSSSDPTPAQPSASTPDNPKTTSPLDTYLRRAQECLDRQNYSQAILELRDALKIDPKNGRCHGLMGLAYLGQNQLTMAGVHIDNALKADPDDPIVRQAKQEYNKKIPHEQVKKSATQTDEKKSGFWNWTKFGDKNK